jgi:AhpD family alkylhydroperoxidase
MAKVFLSIIVDLYTSPAILTGKERNMSLKSVHSILKERTANRKRLEKEAPGLFRGFNGLVKQYYKPGALSRKHKELMAVAAAIATRCIPCLANHANNAMVAGATRQEIIEAAAIGVEFGGGHSFVIVRDNLIQFLDEIENSIMQK